MSFEAVDAESFAENQDGNTTGPELPLRKAERAGQTGWWRSLAESNRSLHRERVAS